MTEETVASQLPIGNMHGKIQHAVGICKPLFANLRLHFFKFRFCILLNIVHGGDSMTKKGACASYNLSALARSSNFKKS